MQTPNTRLYPLVCIHIAAAGPPGPLIPWLLTVPGQGRSGGSGERRIWSDSMESTFWRVACQVFHMSIKSHMWSVAPAAEVLVLLDVVWLEADTVEVVPQLALVALHPVHLHRRHVAQNPDNP